MLIELHESIAAAEPDDAHRDALEALARCDAHGYHFVAALPSVTGRIVGRLRPAGLADRAFRRIAADETGWLPLQEVLPVSLRVEAGLTEPAWEGLPGAGVLRVPLLDCGRAGFERPAALVGENYDDAHLFALVGRAFAASRGLRGLQVSVDPVLGGGTTTPGVYARWQAEARPCLAVVDGDRRYPGGPVGAVARAMERADDAGAPLAAWLALPVRAAENALPHALIREVALGDSAVARALAQHERMQARGLSDVLDVADLRAGTPYYEALANHGSAQRRAFWQGTLPSIRSCPAVPTPSMPCRAACEAGGRDACRCPMVLGFGSVLGRAVGALGRRSPHKSWEAVDDRTRETWELVGARVAAWGAARAPLRS